MPRLFLFVLLAFPIQAGGPDAREFLTRIIEVERHWDVFVRNEFGCKPTGETGPGNCSIAAGRQDYVEFEAWWKAAKKLHGE